MPIQPKGLLFLFRLCVLPAQYASGYAVGGEGRPIPFGADGPAGAAVHDSPFADVALHECLYAAEYRSYKAYMICLGGYYPSAYAGMPAFGKGVFGCRTAAVVEYVAVKFERAYRIGKCHGFLHFAQVPGCISFIEQADLSVRIPSAPAHGFSAIEVETRQ